MRGEGWFDESARLTPHSSPLTPQPHPLSSPLTLNPHPHPSPLTGHRIAKEAVCTNRPEGRGERPLVGHTKGGIPRREGNVHLDVSK